MDVAKQIILLLTGLAVFLLAMRLMSGGLRKLVGPKIKNFFKKTQNNPWAGVGIGTVVTGVIQSSDATAAMVLGFINAGAMTLVQGISVILGAYIGTTVTGVLASFSSLSISLYLLCFAFVGTVMMFIKVDFVKKLGEFLLGFGLLFFGLSVMSEQFQAINASTHCFTNLFASIQFKPLLFLLGIGVTVLLQSSSAMTGIVIAMVLADSSFFSSGLFIILGATIGTISNTFIASIGGSVDSKRATWVCFSLRLLTAILALVFLCIFEEPIAKFFFNLFGQKAGLASAMFLVVYNLITIPLLVPLIKPTCQLFTRLIKDKEKDKMERIVMYVDDKLLNTPSVALLQVKKEIIHMLDLSKENFFRAYNRIKTHDKTMDQAIESFEGQIDYLNNRISKFLINLSPKVSPSESKCVGAYFHVINDIERIGDHAYNFFDMSKKMDADGLSFSEVALGELDQLNDVISKMFDLSKRIFDEQKEDNLKELHSLEEASDQMKNDLCSNHYERITKNLCSADLTPFYTDLISEFERVADHLTNIGYSVINPTGDDEFIAKI